MLFAVEATKRWASDGITANALMPGAIRTHLQRYVENDPATIARWAAAEREGFFWKSTEQGAATSVLLATSPLLEGIGGRYFEDCNEAPVNDSEGRATGVRSLRARPRGRGGAPLGGLAEHARDARRRPALTRPAPTRRIDNRLGPRRR